MSDPREELRQVVRLVTAYLEHHKASGTTGLPKRPRRLASSSQHGVEAHDGGAHVATFQETPPTLPSPRFTGDTTTAPAPARPEAPHAPSFTPEIPLELQSAAAQEAARTPDLHKPPPVEAVRAPEVRLPLLAKKVASCTQCGLAETRTQTVFARGNVHAKLMFLGEAPGADEDAQGLPFVGRAGQLLDKMIRAMGLDPERDVYICNIIKCRPPGNRRPTPEEVAACMPYLEEQLAETDPKVIVALGNTAVAGLLGTSLGTGVGITKLRGQWKLYKGKVLVMPTYHPSYLLRPSEHLATAKKEAWQDLQAVMRELGVTAPAK
jgi:DNA polymerase